MRSLAACALLVGCASGDSDREHQYALSVFVTPNGRPIDRVTAQRDFVEQCELDEYEMTEEGAADDEVSYVCWAQSGGLYTVRVYSGEQEIVRTIEVPASDFDLYRRHPPRWVEVELQP